MITASRALYFVTRVAMKPHNVFEKRITVHGDTIMSQLSMEATLV
jgi:hypothetical protein